MSWYGVRNAGTSPVTMLVSSAAPNVTASTGQSIATSASRGMSPGSNARSSRRTPNAMPSPTAAPTTPSRSDSAIAV